MFMMTYEEAKALGIFMCGKYRSDEKIKAIYNRLVDFLYTHKEKTEAAAVPQSQQGYLDQLDQYPQLRSIDNGDER